MSRASNLAKAIGSDGVLNVSDVAGLAAVASSGSATDLTTGTLPIARIADGAVTAAKLASGVAVSNIGYTPVNKAGDTMSGPLKMDSTAINIVSGNNHSLRFYKDNTDYNAGKAIWALYGSYSDGTMYFTRYDGNPVSQTPADLLALKGNGDLSLPAGNLVLANGKGIDFSVTSNSSGSVVTELLDDYETGTWTPTLNLLSQTGGTLVGRYVKVGKSVWVSFAISGVTCSDTTQDTALATIGGLPFSYDSGYGTSTMITERAYGQVSPTAAHTFGVVGYTSTSLLILDNHYNGTFGNASYYSNCTRKIYQGGALYMNGQLQYFAA